MTHHHVVFGYFAVSAAVVVLQVFAIRLSDAIRMPPVYWTVALLLTALVDGII